MIGDSVAYLLKHFEEVIYDAEHFFDGFKKNRDYAIQTLLAAEAAGAHCLVLCDTNGGSLPHEIAGIIREVKRIVKAETPLGIHVHNDTDCAVANSLAAVSEGISHVQGTMNGYGERCGNANLVSIIPNLMLKMGLPCIPPANLRELRDVSRFVSELANRKPWSCSALCRGLRLRPQGRHPRVRRAEASGDVRAHRSGPGGQSSPGAHLRAGRAVEHPVEGAGVRDRPRQEHPGGPPHPRDAEAHGGRGLPVRGGGGLVRAPDGAGARQSPAVLRPGRLPRDRRGGQWRRGAGGGGHRAAARQGHRRAHRGGGQWAGQCARPRPAQGPRATSTPT